MLYTSMIAVSQHVLPTSTSTDKPVLGASQERYGTVIAVSVDAIVEDHGVPSPILVNAHFLSTGMGKDAFPAQMDKFGEQIAWLVHALILPIGMASYVSHVTLDKFGIYLISAVCALRILNGMEYNASVALMGKLGMKERTHANAKTGKTGTVFLA
jgi:hypothetical protein